MTFEEFCADQFLGGRDKEAFEKWLGLHVEESKPKREWLQLLRQFITQKAGKGNAKLSI